MFAQETEPSEARYLTSYQASQIIETPESVKSEGLLPTLQNIVTGILTGAAPVVSKYFELETAKEKAEALSAVVKTAEAKRAAAVSAAQISAATTRYPSYGAQLLPGVDLASSWPILAIAGIGIGAFLMLRGRGGKSGVAISKKQRKR